MASTLNLCFITILFIRQFFFLLLMLLPISFCDVAIIDFVRFNFFICFLLVFESFIEFSGQCFIALSVNVVCMYVCASSNVIFFFFFGGECVCASKILIIEFRFAEIELVIQLLSWKCILLLWISFIWYKKTIHTHAHLQKSREINQSHN